MSEQPSTDDQMREVLDRAAEQQAQTVEIMNNLAAIADVTAARALAHSVTDAELESGLLYPPMSRLREVSRHVARALLVSGAHGLPGLEADEADQRISQLWWEPEYGEYDPA